MPKSGIFAINMSLYVHIPFCHSKCAYCGFYSVVGGSMRKDWLKAICKEIAARKDELGEATIHKTLYFGGGTPSMLNRHEWEAILQELNNYYHITPNAERTLEANPEDITLENALMWRELGFNRLSIGVQSLNNRALQASNRRHSADEARSAIENAHKAGFENIGIDFIIGLPHSQGKDIELASQLLNEAPITHVSLYILSLDEGSILYKKAQQGEFTPLSDDTEAELYKEYCQMIKSHGFEHYEISNFAKPGYHSKHNTAYWEQEAYIGFGAAAHSYNGTNIRKWNVANIKKYNEAWLNNESSPENGFEKEFLTDIDLFNELIMTRLRTANGLPLNLLESHKFKQPWNSNKDSLQRYIKQGVAKIEEGKISLTEEGWLISDAIFTDLFLI